MICSKKVFFLTTLMCGSTFLQAFKKPKPPKKPGNIATSAVDSVNHEANTIASGNGVATKAVVGVVDKITGSCDTYNKKNDEYEAANNQYVDAHNKYLQDVADYQGYKTQYGAAKLQIDAAVKAYNSQVASYNSQAALVKKPLMPIM